MTNSRLLRVTALGLSKVLHSQPLDVAHAARMADRIVELTGPGAAPDQSAEVLRLRAVLESLSAKCPEGLGLQLLIRTSLEDVHGT